MPEVFFSPLHSRLYSPSRLRRSILSPPTRKTPLAPRVGLGRDPFNQNFRNFWSKTEWISQVQPEKFRKKRSTFRGGPLFSVGPVRSKWTVPFDHSDPFFNPRTSLFGIFRVQNGRKYSSLHFYGLLTADLSVLLVHQCRVTTGL